MTEKHNFDVLLCQCQVFLEFVGGTFTSKPASNAQKLNMFMLS